MDHSGNRDQTLRDDCTIRVSNFEPSRAMASWKLVGVLRPATAHTRQQITLFDGVLWVGRQPDEGQAGATAVIDDPSVSRVHARISRVGDEFVLQDLSSYNGTLVDGVPIVSCVLCDGDMVQIGNNLFFFYRVHQPA